MTKAPVSTRTVARVRFRLIHLLAIPVLASILWLTLVQRATHVDVSLSDLSLRFRSSRVVRFTDWEIGGVRTEFRDTELSRNLRANFDPEDLFANSVNDSRWIEAYLVIGRDSYSRTAYPVYRVLHTPKVEKLFLEWAAESPTESAQFWSGVLTRLHVNPTDDELWGHAETTIEDKAVVLGFSPEENGN